jgi:hypothetical protein
MAQKLALSCPVLWTSSVYFTRHHSQGELIQWLASKLRAAPDGTLVATSVPAQPNGDLETHVEAASASSIGAFFQ